MTMAMAVAMAVAMRMGIAMGMATANLGMAMSMAMGMAMAWPKIFQSVGPNRFAALFFYTDVASNFPEYLRCCTPLLKIIVNTVVCAQRGYK